MRLGSQQPPTPDVSGGLLQSNRAPICSPDLILTFVFRQSAPSEFWTADQGNSWLLIVGADQMIQGTFNALKLASPDLC